MKLKENGGKTKKIKWAGARSLILGAMGTFLWVLPKRVA
jgi:hypothetical protein